MRFYSSIPALTVVIIIADGNTVHFVSMEMGLLPRILFYPTLVHNICLEKVTNKNWYDYITETILEGLPFKSMTKRLTDVEKVKGIVNITEPYETRCLCNTSEDWQKYSVDQIHISVPDFTASPSIKQMLSAIQFIKQFENTGRVYVHCKAGRSRSATIVAAYLMATKAFNPEKAIEEIPITYCYSVNAVRNAKYVPLVITTE